jgi:hypothetical protein
MPGKTRKPSAGKKAGRPTVKGLPPRALTQRDQRKIKGGKPLSPPAGPIPIPYPTIGTK